MLYFETPAWIIGGLVLTIILVLNWRQKHSLPALVCWLVFGFYILLVVRATLFPIPFAQKAPDGLSLPEYFIKRINLVPFFYGRFATVKSISLAILGNIILTLPFGFCVNFVTHIRAKSFIWLGPLIGLTIEMTQLVICLVVRFPYRVVDINDLWANAVGVWLGYVLFRILGCLYLVIIRHIDIQPNGFTAYLIEMTQIDNHHLH
jgi:glycopeptide antibiotics resistance protein